MFALCSQFCLSVHRKRLAPPGAPALTGRPVSASFLAQVPDAPRPCLPCPAAAGGLCPPRAPCRGNVVPRPRHGDLFQCSHRAGTTGRTLAAGGGIRGPRHRALCGGRAYDHAGRRGPADKGRPVPCGAGGNPFRAGRGHRAGATAGHRGRPRWVGRGMVGAVGGCRSAHAGAGHTFGALRDDPEPRRGAAARPGGGGARHPRVERL
jgi:hypothetical protein